MPRQERCPTVPGVRSRNPAKLRRQQDQLEIQGGFCYYCPRRLNDQNRTVDHVLPSSWGATYRRGQGDLVLACKKCNGLKSGIESWVFGLYKEASLEEKVARFAKRAGFIALRRQKILRRPDRKSLDFQRYENFVRAVQIELSHQQALGIRSPSAEVSDAETESPARSSPEIGAEIGKKCVY